MSFEMPTANQMKEEVLSAITDSILNSKMRMTPDELALYTLKHEALRKEIAEGIRGAAAQWERKFSTDLYPHDIASYREMFTLLENLENELLRLGYAVTLSTHNDGLQIYITW